MKQQSAELATGLHQKRTKTIPQYKYEIFMLLAPHGPQPVIPAKYLDELKSLAENKISLAQSLRDV